jgi:osmotically-inducible protein OsmY
MSAPNVSGHSPPLLPAARPADAGRAAEQAEARLRAHPYLALQRVSCECRDGVLVLRGRLPTYYLKQIAQALVAGIDGVRQVDNQVEVAAGA